MGVTSESGQAIDIEMGVTSGSGQVTDIESQQTHETTSLLIASWTRSRRRWRWIHMSFKVCQIFKKAVNANTGCWNAPTYDLESQTALELTAPILPQEEEAQHLGITVEEKSETSISIITVTSSNNSIDALLQRDKIEEIVRTRDLDTLREFGGVTGIAEALNTDLSGGILDSDEDRLSRRSPTRPGFFRFLFRHCNDWTIILLLVAAALYIAFGVKTAGPETGWCPGTVIVLAVVVLVLAPTLHDLWLSRLAAAAEEKIVDVDVDVFRGGRREKVPVSDLVPGDVVWLDQSCSLVPADGLFIDGDFLVVSDGLESSADNESPFLFHGSTVTHGSGTMLVTAVGIRKELVEAMSRSPAGDRRAARLASKLDKLRRVVQVACLVISIVITVVAFLGLILHRHGSVKPSLPEVKGKPVEIHRILDMIERILMSPAGGKISSVKVPVAVLVLGVLEGMPFVIALAAIYWMKRMLAGKASAAMFLDCDKMGSATTVVADKTLFMNEREVAELYVGGVDLLPGEMAVAVVDDLCDGISTPVVVSSSLRKQVMVEDPVLNWAVDKLGMRPDASRRDRTVKKMKRLSSGEEGSRVLMLKKRKHGRAVDDRAELLHCKGPATTVLRQSSSYYGTNGYILDLDEGKRAEFETRIEAMRNNNLKAVAYAIKQVTTVPIPTLDDDNDDTGLTLIAILGLSTNHSCSSPETREALRYLRDAGLKIVLVSEDDDASEMNQAAVALGILPPDGLVMSGEEFRALQGEEATDKARKITTIGAADPSDRLLLIRRLKEKENMVVVLGTRTTEAPAMKEADLGVAMGEWSSAAARESSGVVVLDGRLSSLAAVVQCGRCVYGNVQKYVQLEMTASIVGTLVSSITTVWRGSSPITGFQLIWTTFAVTVLAGPALLLEPPPPAYTRRRSPPSPEPLVSAPMWRNIVVQSLYQTTVLIAFHSKGAELAMLGFTTEKAGKAMVFNAFFLCQVFNLVSSREIERKNFLAGINRNWWLPVAAAATLALQAGFVGVAHAVVDDAKLDLKQWGVCLLIGLFSWPVDFAAKIASDFFVKHLKPSANMTHSTSPDSINNLELPLMSTSSNSSSIKT